MECRQNTREIARPFNSAGTRGSTRGEFDGFIPGTHIRFDPKKWGSRPCGTPYRWDL